MEQAWLAIVRGERRGPLAMLARCGLRLASWPYGLGVRTRNALFSFGWRQAHRVPVPVVSIGNLTLGGTGKTPCVEYVARLYRDLGVRVAILSRGYGGSSGRNDEAMVLEHNLPDVPHLQGANRLELATTAVEELETELLVLDDGFQHRRLHRDLDVVLIDATRPPMNDRLFPRGTLREPPGSLARAGAIVLTRCDQVPADELAELRAWVARRSPGKLVAATVHRPKDLLAGNESEPVERLRGRAVAGFCGIANPAAFRGTLEAMGAEVVNYLSFPDHHSYTREDVAELERWAAAMPADAWIATTQKDWVKLRLDSLAGHPLRAVRIGLAFQDGREGFDAALRKIAPAAAQSSLEE